MLHGREYVAPERDVVTKGDIADLIRASSGGGGTFRLVDDGGRHLAEIVLENTPDAAERLGLT